MAAVRAERRGAAAELIASLYGLAGAAVGLWVMAGAGLQTLAGIAELAPGLRLESTWPDPVALLAEGLPALALGAAVAWWHLR